MFIFQHAIKNLKNQHANFNQTWHKISLGKGNSKFFKLRQGSLQRGDNYKNGVGSFKNLLHKNHIARRAHITL
jgi:hypothetical protein